MSKERLSTFQHRETPLSEKNFGKGCYCHPWSHCQWRVQIL